MDLNDELWAALQEYIEKRRQREKEAWERILRQLGKEDHDDTAK